MALTTQISRGPIDADCIGNPRAQGKAKYAAWKSAVEEDKLTAEQAQEKYIQHVEEYKAKYGFDADKEPEAVGA